MIMKTKVTVLVSDKIDFESQMIKRDKEDYYTKGGSFDLIVTV